MGRKKIHFDSQSNMLQQTKRQDQHYFDNLNISPQSKKKCGKVVDFIDNVLDQEMINTIQAYLETQSQRLCQFIKFKAYEKRTIRTLKCKIKEMSILISLKQSENQFISGELNTLTFADRMCKKVELVKGSILVLLSKFFKMSKIQFRNYFKLTKEFNIQFKKAKNQATQKIQLKYFQNVLQFLHQIQNQISWINSVFLEKFQEFTQIKLKNNEKEKEIVQKENLLEEEDYVLQEDLFIILMLNKFKDFIKERKTQQKDIDAVISNEINKSIRSINQRIRNICWLKTEDLKTYIEKNNFLVFDQRAKNYYFRFEKENVQNLMKIKNKEMIKNLRDYIKIKKMTSPLTPQKINSLKQIYDCNQDIQKSSFVLSEESFIQKQRKCLEQIPQIEEQNNFVDQKKIPIKKKNLISEFKRDSNQEYSITKQKIYSKKQKQISSNKKRPYSRQFNKNFDQFQDQTTQYGDEIREGVEKSQSLQSKNKAEIKKNVTLEKIKQEQNPFKKQKQIKINCQMLIGKNFKNYQELSSCTRMAQSIILNESEAQNLVKEKKDQEKFSNFKERISKFLKNVVNKKIFKQLEKKLAEITLQFLKWKANNEQINNHNYKKISCKFLNKIKQISLPIMLKEKQNEIADQKTLINQSLKQVCTILQMNFEDAKKNLHQLTSLSQHEQQMCMKNLINSKNSLEFIDQQQKDEPINLPKMKSFIIKYEQQK